MKQPVKLPPAELSATATDGNINAPNINVAEAALTGMELESGVTPAAPKLMPPEVAEEGVTAYEAVVWNSDKRVNGLYTTFHARNSWMSISGLGWKKLSTTNDSSCEAMTLLAAHCREKACRIDFSEENGVVKEIYVW